MLGCAAGLTAGLSLLLGRGGAESDAGKRRLQTTEAGKGLSHTCQELAAFLAWSRFIFFLFFIPEMRCSLPNSEGCMCVFVCVVVCVQYVCVCSVNIVLNTSYERETLKSVGDDV